MRNYTKLVQVLIGAGLVVGMNGAMAKLWQNEEMTNEVIPDGNYNYVVEGNAWLNSHTYFSHNPSVVKIGGNLNRVGDLGVAKLELQDHTTVSVDGNVRLDTLANNGLMKIGGTIRCHTTFRHPFNFSWSGKTCDIRRSSKTTS